MRRDIDALAADTFDVTVIGGGIVGACTAWDAALRGLRTALVDAGDFGSGTSGNSLKVVHGGLRYLQHLDVRRMRQSIRERSTWLRIAPHLVEPLPVLVPTRGYGRQGAAPLRAAVAISDLLGWDRNDGLVPERRLPAGRLLTRRECLELAPQLEATPFSGGVLFHDAQMYSPERVVLEVVQAAAAAGATVANYVACERAAEARSGSRTLVLRDAATGERFRVRSRVTVNATGPLVARVATRLGVTHPAMPRYSVALNLVLPYAGHRAAFSFEADARDPDVRLARGGRQLFAVPWRGRTLIGTAHYAFAGDPRSFRVSRRFADRFVQEVSSAWPGGELDGDAVQLVLAGYLPDAAGGEGGVRLLKRHRIADHAAQGRPDLISVVSVKFTTARLLAEEVVDLVLKKLERAPIRSATARTPLPGGGAAPEELLRRASARCGQRAPAEVVAHLVRTYGTRYERVLELVGEDRRLGERVVAGSPVIRAQLVHAVRAELARTAEDLLRRRTELAAVGADSAEARRWAESALVEGPAPRPTCPASTEP